MIISDVVCPFCGCLCDDLELEVEGDRVVRVQNGCSLAEATFMHDTRLPTPIRRTKSGWEDISYDDAIKETAAILKKLTGRCCTGGAARTGRHRAWVSILPS